MKQVSYETALHPSPFQGKPKTPGIGAREAASRIEEVLVNMAAKPGGKTMRPGDAEGKYQCHVDEGVHRSAGLGFAGYVA
jgi:hypothetical protein